MAGRNYQYYTNSKGEHVMRVSDVIRMLAKEQINLWANNLGFKGIRYKAELERTANIGSLCHKVLETYFNPRTLAEVDFDQFDITSYGDKLEVMNALNSFFTWYTKFRKTHTYNIKFTEYVVVGDELGGTIDLGIDGWEDPNKVIFCDYKTSSEFYLTQFLQLAAYVMIYEELHGKNTVEGVMVILLDKKGGAARARFLLRENLDAFILCFQCLFDVARGTKMLEANLRDLTEKMN